MAFEEPSFIEGVFILFYFIFFFKELAYDPSTGILRYDFSFSFLLLLLFLLGYSLFIYDRRI